MWVSISNIGLMPNIKCYAYKSVSQSGSVISATFCPPGSGSKRQNNNDKQKKTIFKMS